MALSNISLSSGMRNNLLGMQSTAKMLNTTSERLGTGRKVNSALDNASSFFAAQSHMQRANDLAARKDGMSEAIQTIKAADAGIKGITTMVEQIKGLVNDSAGASDEVKAANQKAIAELASQIDDLVADSNYKGTNLLTSGSTTYSSDLNVYFNESGSRSMTVSGVASDATTLGKAADGTGFSLSQIDISKASIQDGQDVKQDGTLTTLTKGDGTTLTLDAGVTLKNLDGSDLKYGDQFVDGDGKYYKLAKGKGLGDAYAADGTVTLAGNFVEIKPEDMAGGEIPPVAFEASASIDEALSSIQNALGSLRATSTQLSANMGVITARQEFTSNIMNTLQIGSDNLILADLNEEGANMLALQTQQQLSTSALSLASQANQAVLRLF